MNGRYQGNFSLRGNALERGEDFICTFLKSVCDGIKFLVKVVGGAGRGGGEGCCRRPHRRLFWS